MKIDLQVKLPDWNVNELENEREKVQMKTPIYDQAKNYCAEISLISFLLQNCSTFYTFTWAKCTILS